MSKYIRKSEIVNAELYKEGMEDGYILYYSGNMFDYKKVFKTKEECIKYIADDKGKLECNTDDEDYEIIYEEPQAFVIIEDTKYFVKDGYYIIENDEGEKQVFKKKVFETIFVKIEE